MTASDPTVPELDGDDAAGNRSLAEWALDLLVYVPAGIVATALDDMDAMADKGKARVDQQLRNAQVVGRFAVDIGLRRLKEQAESLLAARGAQPAAPSATTAASPAAPWSGATAPATTAPGAPPEPVPPAVGGRARQRPADPTGRSARDPEVDRAIADYDTLSASQVVRRLDGLDARELAAIVRHERATRGRRTILHRAEQLLDEHPPASPGSPAAP